MGNFLCKYTTQINKDIVANGTDTFLLVVVDKISYFHVFHTNYMFKWRENFFFYENITYYLKNQWTKHRLLYTHFDPFSML